MGLNRRTFLASSAAFAGISSAGIARADAEVEWNWISIQPLSQAFLALIADGFERIRERTDGRFVVRHSSITETPYHPSEGLNIIRDGLADVIEWYPGYVTNTYPMLAAAELPFLMPEYWPTDEGVDAALRAWESPSVKAATEEVFRQHGATTGIRLIWEPISIWSNRETMSPLDLDGAAVRANTREMGDFINNVNGVAEFMPITEAYLALQRNALQGFSGSAASVMTYKLFEVLKSGVMHNGQYVSGTFLVRQDALDALPADLRQVYDEEMAATQQAVIDFASVSEGTSREKAREAGLNVRDVTPEEYAQLRAVAEETVWPMWKERVGEGADQVLEEVLAAVASR